MAPVSKSVKIAGATGIAVIAAGIGASQALAGTTTATPSATSTTAPSAGTAQDEKGPGGGPGAPGGRHGGRGVDTAALATTLGVTEAKLEAALTTVREAQKSAAKPADGTKPTDAERAAREKARNVALAKELGLTEAKVAAAYDALKAERAAARRTELTTRLDAAVKAGDPDRRGQGGRAQGPRRGRPRRWPRLNRRLPSDPGRAPSPVVPDRGLGVPIRRRPPGIPPPGRAATRHRPGYAGRPGLDLVGRDRLWHTGAVA